VACFTCGQLATAAWAASSEVVAVPWRPGNADAFQKGTPAEHGARAAQGELSVTLYRPDGAGPFPFVVLLHGCGGLHERAMWTKWVEPWVDILRAHGIGAAVVDSFGPRGVAQVCSGDVAGWAVRRADDAYSVRAWLGEQPYVDAAHIAAMGMSNGGRTVLAAMHAPLRQSAAFIAGIALYPGCQSDSASTFYAPLLVLGGRADTVAPVRYCEQMKQSQPPSAAPVTLVIYPYAPHTFDMNLPDRVHLRMRLGYDAEAAADARQQVIDFLGKRGIGRASR
jgi:dienelactone hydrolase